MPKKMMTILIVLAFVCSSLLLMVSCAKKQVQVEERIQPTTEESKVDTTKETDVRKAEEEKPTITKKVESGDDEAYRKAEAERKDRLRELEFRQKLFKEIKEFESESIYFEFDKADLRPEAQVNLKKKAEWLRFNPAYSVRIEGHCDERGTNEYNLALGERRAHSAKNFLVALGIGAYRILTISYGEEKPADPGHTEDAWAKNRRDEFKIVK
jgi:peptidoglycan-associated lipoprotein